MNTFLATDFLGTTSKQLKSSTFQISIVDYTQQVSEAWHWHEKIHISSIIRGGNLESRKKKDIQVSSGKVMVYEQGEAHRNRFTAHPSRNLNIELEEDFFEDGIEFSNLQLEDNAKIELDRIYFELSFGDKYSVQSIRQILKSLFWQDKYANPSKWIPQLENLLQERWNEFPSLDELSSELDIHPITISKYFAKHKGLTLSAYMRRLKVKRAIDLLMNSSSSIPEIAFECGFSDQSHMTRLVKSYTGYTPGNIRSLS